MNIAFDRILIEAAFIFFISAGISIPGLSLYIIVLMRLMVIGFIVLQKLKHRNMSMDLFVVFGWFFLIALTTLFNKRSVFHLADSFSSIFLITIYYSWVGGLNQKLRVLSVWSKLMLLLCIIDGITMILYPNGMPTKSYYKLTWFLGYKTARMVYLLPMAIFLPYIDLLQNGKIRKRDYFAVLFCLVLTIKAQAIGAVTVLIIYFVLLVFLRMIPSNSKAMTRIRKLFNPVLICVIYGALFVVVTIIQTNPYVQYLIQDIFEKSSDLSHRTIIWNACFDFFKKKPLFGGGYLTVADYVELTNFRLGTSAHSMVLSILVTCGLVGLAYYIFMIARFLELKDQRLEKCQAVAFFGVIAMMVLGLISSVMLFSMFSILLFQLIQEPKDAYTPALIYPNDDRKELQ